MSRKSRSLFSESRERPSLSEPIAENVAGTVERVTFHNPDNGFCVLRVRLRGRRDVDTLVGSAATIAAGEFIQATGRWTRDREYGLQFRASDLSVSPPTSVAAIERYLASGMIKGVGPVYSRRLVESFGVEVFDVIENAPERLRAVTGIGLARAERIVSGWAAQRAVREIMLFLHGHGVSAARAVRIHKTYGAAAIRLITENPYRLARDIRGIGFHSADAIARSVGIDHAAVIRARAGLHHTLSEAMNEGHCGLPLEALLSRTERLLAVPASILQPALDKEIEAGDLVADRSAGRLCVFLSSLYRAEKAIAGQLAHIAQGRIPWPEIDVEKAIPWVEARTGLALARGQKNALALALRAKLLVVTGGPGVGKTTLLNSLLAILRAKGVSVALAAPTGRAAKRLNESTGMAAKTIHRLLEVDPIRGGFRRNESRRLDCDLLVIDETSMVDVPLMQALLRAVPDHAGLLLVGDVDQLASVGPGQALADIIESGAVPVVRLTEIFRQAAESRIVQTAHRIRSGSMPELTHEGASGDFFFAAVEDAERAASLVREIVKERIPRRFGLDPVRDVQVLCPMNRGVLGARNLNVELQRDLNPGGGPRVERFGFAYGRGDKVMQIENDYDKEVFNGDLGFIKDVDLENGLIAVDFDGRSVGYDLDDLDSLAPAYAVTIHKAQGSEYPAVVIPLTTQHYPMLRRHVIYTGVTRGRRLVVLVGQKKALAIAVKGRQAERRVSKLRDWLAAESGAGAAATGSRAGNGRIR
ncbi:MAG: ATP-dependent RecD-like DNA helicase [Vicinamibacteria bacterium]|nr:ATP-dependent RecD-like DNA helicase [Vicinamibacteria bacterium]